MRKCLECPKLFYPEHEEQLFCDRHCARIHQARHGIPSQEDKEATFSAGVIKLYHDVFDIKKDKR